MGDVEKLKIKTSQSKEIKEKNTEQKERIAERKKFQKLCVKYHTSHGREWNMNSQKIDQQLYKEFKTIDVSKLPDYLKWIYWHRLSYLQAMVHLGKSERIVKFVKKYQKILERRHLQPNQFNATYRKISASEEFKTLTQSDFRAAKLALEGAIVILSGIRVKSGWEAKAKLSLKPDEVDDMQSYQNLLGGFKLILGNVKKVEKKKFPQNN